MVRIHLLRVLPGAGVPDDMVAPEINFAVKNYIAFRGLLRVLHEGLEPTTFGS